MKKITSYIIGIAAALTLVGCGENRSQEAVLGPEETVEAFWRAAAGGDFDQAKTLCDTTSMAEYIDRCRVGWEKTMQADSSAALIAAGILSSAEITFTGNTKEGDARKITFAIKAEMGMEKEKSATVKKKEGVWKVEKMTDGI